jgi:YVTN family beta-propeller protein
MLTPHSFRLWVAGGFLAALAVACSGNDQPVQPPTPPPAQPPPPPPPPPPPNACTEASPVCDPGCGNGTSCVFSAGTCSCQQVCNSDPAQRVCAGGGPNQGCGDGFECNASCQCVAVVTCVPDAPACAGNGPNNGCAQDQVCNGQCTCVARPPPPATLARPSRSTAVDVTTDDSIVAMVNSDDGSVSFFNAAFGEESRIARVRSSMAIARSEPSSVVIHPDRKTAFVANRAAGTVSKIRDVDSAGAAVVTELEIGSEPVGLALTPTGAELWVTDWIAGKVVVVDTAAMRVIRTIPTGGNPFAIAITNDGDADDADEKALVTQFFARARPGAQDVEGTDDGKEGRVLVIRAGASSVAKEIALTPIESCFNAPVGNPPQDLTSGCFPNQLWGITIHAAFGKNRAYVISTAASPEGPTNFNHNVQAVVSVIDLDVEAEEPALTKNLNLLIKQQQVDNDGDENIGRRFLNTPSGIDFVNRDDVAIAYVSSAASDVVLRVQYAADGTVNVGAAQAFNIPVGQNPQGIVIKHGSTNAGAFVANSISRDLSVVSFRDQRQVKTVVSTDQPQDPTSAEFKVWRGKRFFNTSTGIWAKEGWGSCQGCHPFGLTDNVTWKFAAGPRQTVALDGQYASNDPSDMRALNWTAIFDETADFENNTRGVSGGRGAIQNAQGPIVSPMGPPFSSILVEDGQTRENHQALNGSLEFVTRRVEICANANTCPDWDLVDLYIQSIRSPRGVASAEVAQGRALFEEGGCNKCHAGAKWTVSRTFYRPEVFTGALPSRTFEANRAFTTAMDPTTLRTLPRDVNRDTTLLAGDDSDGGTPALKRQACNVRDVGTFGATGGATETRDNGTPAQGQKGFNPPSLLNIAAGAPYLHNGAAETVDALFEGRFDRHTQSGNPNFVPTAQERAALKAFLLSIDESTAPFAILADTVLCPNDFTP